MTAARTTAATLMAASLTLSLSLGALAQDSPQEQRHAIMEDVGDAMGVLGGMAKGETAYDADAAIAALDTMITEAPVFLTLFPEGSETGHDTRAKPEIWSDRAGFEEKGEAMITAASNAKETAGNGLDALRAAMGPLGQSCRGCHETYRAPKN
ncbi:c-type cytochrome [Acuticoccus yangtzensis]|uniref:c-type cytochrome n=1 Tax=Acuticoccus yangtzensis TaxID=1443441 RepID=UPI000949637D|nr:cytochrome c [Acuticoccus yangtzensis]